MKKDRVLLVLKWVLILGGVAVASWPLIQDAIVAHNARTKISEIESTYDSMSSEERKHAMDQAHAYNEVLAGRPNPLGEEEIWDYDTQLTYHDEPSTMMSWIEIPKIDVKLAVYHHATEAVLMAGVGHIDATSIPVGGEGTNCVVSAHSGMQSTRMFDDIRALEKGDKFVFWTLKEPFAYEVVEIRDMVEPTDTRTLETVPGRDLATLVTCTPYNVNTHRLVVIGERCEYVPDEEPVPVIHNSRSLAPILLASGAVLALILIAVIPKVRKRIRNEAAKSCTDIENTL